MYFTTYNWNVLNSRKIDRKCLGTARLSSGYGGSAPGTITAGNLILAPFHYYLLIIWATMVRDGRLLKARVVVCKLDLLARYGRVYARERPPPTPVYPPYVCLVDLCRAW